MSRGILLFMKKKIEGKLSAQDIQDKIFRKMSANKKLKLGSDLWILAKELEPAKVGYSYEKRPKTSFSKDR